MTELILRRSDQLVLGSTIHSHASVLLARMDEEREREIEKSYVLDSYIFMVESLSPLFNYKKRIKLKIGNDTSCSKISL